MGVRESSLEEIISIPESSTISRSQQGKEREKLVKRVGGKR